MASHVAHAGFVCGPNIDLSLSPHFNLAESRVVEWILCLLQRAVMLAPPSPAAHPCVRSYREPQGFDRKHPKTWLGNRLAFMSFAIFVTAVRCGAAVMLENPRLSKMAWTRGWKFLRALPQVTETWTASCAFGAPYRKEFRLLLSRLDSASIHRKCPGCASHVRIEGQLTKQSAVYVPRLAAVFGEAFSCFLREWTTLFSWKWRAPTHINVLEAMSGLTLMNKLAAAGDLRYNHILDSNVAKGSLTKRRSSSSVLSRILSRLLPCS